MLSSLVTLLLCRFTMAFYTNAVEKPDPYAKTHTDITNKGIFKALAYYIINNKDSNYQDEETAFREFFKPGRMYYITHSMYTTCVRKCLARHTFKKL